MTDDDETGEIFDEAGRVNLPPPSPEALQAAAQDCLGDADEALLTDGGKLFRGSGAPGAFFLQGPDEEAGTILTAASRELQDRLMAEAARTRRFQAEEALSDFTDPAKNPLIRLDPDA